MYIIAWTNKHSNEKGFVQSISSKEQHFVNTFDKKDAKQYKTASVANRMISTLTAYGEATNNTFELVEV